MMTVAVGDFQIKGGILANLAVYVFFQHSSFSFYDKSLFSMLTQKSFLKYGKN